MFPINCRDLELMLLDRGVSVDHSTISRWIQAYAVELEKRIRPHLRMRGRQVGREWVAAHRPIHNGRRRDHGWL
jgi:transposase-like protein